MATTGIHIRADKTLEQVQYKDYLGLQALVDGSFEIVELTFGDLWVNEEFTYRFSTDQVNWIASDLAGLGGRPEFMLRSPILGPAVLTGGADEDGETLDVTEDGLRALIRVAREAGGTWVKTVRAEVL